MLGRYFHALAVDSDTQENGRKSGFLVELGDFQVMQNRKRIAYIN